MNFLTIKDLGLENKKVLVRVDFNVPLDDKGNITSDKRIKETLPTIKYLLDNNCKVILMSHLDDPEKLIEKGKSLEEVKKKLTLKPIAKILSKILGKEVAFIDDCISKKLPDKQIILLENLRFHKEEKKNDETFAQKLASYADFYVNDAFGTCHRAHASVYAVTKFLPSAIGFLVEKEVKNLKPILTPKKPFIVIIGGAKEDKIDVIKSIINKVDYLIIGGVLSNTFLKASDVDIKSSKFSPESIGFAKDMLKKYKEKIILPLDVVVAEKFAKDANSKIVTVDKIPANWLIMDIGPKTIELYKKKLRKSKTIFWAGPIGVFEFDKFSKGTKAIAEFISKLDAITVIGGGDSASAVEKFNLHDKMTFVSTGGGASLEFIEGKQLPALKALEESYQRIKK